MFQKIMVPIDLGHIPSLEKALNVAADLAKHFQASVCYVGVTPQTPSPVAHNISEYSAKLEAFGQAEAAKRGHQVTTRAFPSHDPAIDLDNVLLNAVTDVGADLVVMASHIPGLVEYVWPSHGGKIASHSNASVFIVR